MQFVKNGQLVYFKGLVVKPEMILFFHEIYIVEWKNVILFLANTWFVCFSSVFELRC